MILLVMYIDMEKNPLCASHSKFSHWSKAITVEIELLHSFSLLLSFCLHSLMELAGKKEAFHELS